MTKSVKFIARTGMFIALLVAVQFITKSLGQMVTGSCVNLILAISAMTCGFWSSAIVALVSPFLAFLLGIGPAFIQIVPAVAVGNLVYSAVLSFGVTLIAKYVKQYFATSVIAVIAGSLLKFATLFLLVTKIIVPFLAQAGTIAAKQVTMLSTMFSVPQLFTALIGGAIAILIVPTLKKALK